MKKIMKSLALVALLVSTFVFGANAQNQTQHGKNKLKAILTADQQAMLKQINKNTKRPLMLSELP
jgi:hypothetical protein